MDYIKFKNEWNKNLEWENANRPELFGDNVINSYPDVIDHVNSPAHYTRGRVEVIEVIEDAVKDAPDTFDAVLQGNILKYLLRLWVKENPLQDAKKARWYLDRLITRLENDT